MDIHTDLRRCPAVIPPLANVESILTLIVWGVDVSDLRQTREEFDFRRKAARALYRQRLNIFFPLLPVGMLCTFLSFVLIPWVEWTAIVLFLLATIWAAIQWGRYLWLRHLIKLVLADFARRSATSAPPDASAHA